MRLRYLLDTNVVSRLARRAPPGGILARLAEHPAAAAISAVTVEELAYGARVAPAARRPQLDEFVSLMLERFVVLPYDEDAALWVADQRMYLRDVGRTVAHPDLCVAGVAGSRGMVVVTHNRAHFDVMRGLAVEDWEAMGAEPADEGSL